MTVARRCLIYARYSTDNQREASIEDQLRAADVEVILGKPEEAFARLINLVRSSGGAERDTVRSRLLELFETVGAGDPRVLKARRDLMAALF